MRFERFGFFLVVGILLLACGGTALPVSVETVPTLTDESISDESIDTASGTTNSVPDINPEPVKTTIETVEITLDTVTSDYRNEWWSKLIYFSSFTESDDPMHDAVIFRGLLLDGPGTYKFVHQKPDDGKVRLMDDDGSVQMIGVRIGKIWDGEHSNYVNPMDGMSDTEISQLRGVVLEHWSDEISSQLHKLDMMRTVITLTEHLPESTHNRLPALPENTRYIMLNSTSSSSDTDDDYLDYSTLGNMQSLVLLDIDSMDGVVDLLHLNRNNELRYLSLNSVHAINADSLSYRKKLRVLRLSNIEELYYSSFISEFTHLRYLDISGTPVSVLPNLDHLKELSQVHVRSSPMESLKFLNGSKSIVTVIANMSRIKELPSGQLPTLKKLSIFSTSVSKKKVHRFHKNNPNCHVDFSWGESLRSAVQNADLVQVMDALQFKNKPQHIVDIDDKNEIRELILHLQVYDSKMWLHCMCEGDQKLVFFHKGKKLTSITVHHGLSLRWNDGWPGDADMTEKGSNFLVKWLSRHGFPETLEEIEADKQPDQ